MLSFQNSLYSHVVMLLNLYKALLKTDSTQEYSENEIMICVLK